MILVVPIEQTHEVLVTLQAFCSRSEDRRLARLRVVDRFSERLFIHWGQLILRRSQQSSPWHLAVYLWIGIYNIH